MSAAPVSSTLRVDLKQCDSLGMLNLLLWLVQASDISSGDESMAGVMRVANRRAIVNDWAAARHTSLVSSTPLVQFPRGRI